ncbi:adenylate/guanylate cyclase domain-containing protein [Bradyrhizobium sp. C-145]|uniref:adenylate/guanylate cyclase domain-containing protein n=1 Tax=Bradyrhizobium sp. C-145 TaxID=574727 RepID=UPI00201B930C|nr:adenylate/guanylate cyclase domain-containing protein [Bradyrhizobium sp. C-145]UQR63189.1 adenylate/guanylate cyclase domain-containing protein [Bradyrhizobium sp. C-145]
MLRYLACLSSYPVAAGLAVGIFLIDTLTSLHFAVASLYVIVVLIAAHDRRRRAIVIAGVICALLTVVSYVLMHGLEEDGAAPLRFAVSLVSILIATILVLRNVSANLRVEAVERERANLARFFSPKIIDQLVDIYTPFSFARRQSAAVLFADMIGFTAYSSGKPPDLIIGLLRDVLQLLSEAVFSNDGSVDKYLGDGLMAFFGPPLTSGRDATNAALCALEIVNAIECWNDRRTRCNEDPVRIAVGIHYGDVVQGDVGSERRLELTLVGDTVNIASRVEAYCRILDAPLLVTGEFRDALLAEGSLDLAKAFVDEGPHMLRGCKEPIRLFSMKREPKSQVTMDLRDIPEKIRELDQRRV